MCFKQNSYNTATTKQKHNLTLKTLAGAGIWTQDLSHPKRMRYLSTTVSNQDNDCSQPI